MKIEWLKKLKIRHKIALPFILLIFITACIAGPIAANWVAAKIRSESRKELDAQLGAAKRYLNHRENYLRVLARSYASFPLIEEATKEKSETKFRQVLLPQKIISEIDFVEVVDDKGKVIFNHLGPYEVGVNLSPLDSVKTALLDITSSEIVTQDKYSYLIAAAPIHKREGVNGALITGLKLDNELMKKIAQAHYQITIYLDTKPIASTLTRPMPIDEATYEEVVSTQQPLQQTVKIGKSSYLSLLSPLEIGKRTKVVIQVANPAETVRSALRTVVLNVIVLNSLLLLIMGFLGYLIARWITDPIYALVEQSKKVTAGDLETKIEAPTRDEIEILATSFSQTVQSLKKKTEDLRQRLFELSVLHDISLTIGSTLDIEDILPVVAESTRRLFNADVVCVMTRDPATNQMTEGLCSKSPRVAGEIVEFLEEELAKKVEKEGATIVSENEEAPFLKSMMGVPLLTEGEFSGVILVGSVDRTYIDEDLQVLTTLGQQTAVALANARLFQSLQDAYLGIVRALAIALDARDPYTRGHSEQVAKYALMIADEMSLSPREKQSLEMAAYLHDIGKIGIRDEILLKPARLTAEEMKAIREHPAIGASILAPLSFLGEIVPTVKYHHEHYNGEGYPEGLKKERIPLGARILSLGDAFDAITSERPYRAKRSIKQAVAELKRCSGSQFDPHLVEIFIRALKKRGIYNEE
jgi:putative nucleotidyltransferase with HDIG domain